MNQQKKILFLNGSPELAKTMWSKKAFARAEKYGFEITIPTLKNASREDWANLLSNYDAAITCWGSPWIDRDMLRKATQLRIIGHAAGSVCAVISEEVYTHDLKVITANPVMAEAVAEWSLMATLIASRNIGGYAQWFGHAPLRWKSSDKIRNLSDMTIGVWGYGDISSRLFRMLAPLHPGRLLVHSNHTDSAALAAVGATKVTLEEIFAESDVIHLLAGLTAENIERIGRHELGLIRDGATLINAGRARLIQQEALLEALQTRRFKAMLDVFYGEPLPEDDPLRRFDNVMLTPHNAGEPGREHYIPFLLDEFDRFFRGESLAAEITLPRYRTMTVERLAMAASV